MATTRTTIKRADANRTDKNVVDVEQTTCPECNEPAVTDCSNGYKEKVCSNCGLVITEDLVDPGPEWRSFDGSEQKTRRCSGSVDISTHDRSLGSTIRRSDLSPASGITSRHLEQQSRIKTVNKKERNLRLALSEVRRLCGSLELSMTIRDRAAYLFREVHSTDYLEGRSIEAGVGAAVYQAVREADLPVKLSRIADLSRGCDEREIRTLYKGLKELLGWTATHTGASSYLRGSVGDLDVSEEVRILAHNLVSKVEESTVNRAPSVVAGTSTYIAARELHESLTQERVSGVFDISTASIRNCRDDLEEHDLIETVRSDGADEPDHRKTTESSSEEIDSLVQGLEGGPSASSNGYSSGLVVTTDGGCVAVDQQETSTDQPSDQVSSSTAEASANLEPSTSERAATATLVEKDSTDESGLSSVEGSRARSTTGDRFGGDDHRPGCIGTSLGCICGEAEATSVQMNESSQSASDSNTTERLSLYDPEELEKADLIPLNRYREDDNGRIRLEMYPQRYTKRAGIEPGDWVQIDIHFDEEGPMIMIGGVPDADKEDMQAEDMTRKFGTEGTLEIPAKWVEGDPQDASLGTSLGIDLEEYLKLDERLLFDTVVHEPENGRTGAVALFPVAYEGGTPYEPRENVTMPTHLPNRARFDTSSIDVHPLLEEKAQDVAANEGIDPDELKAIVGNFHESLPDGQPVDEHRLDEEVVDGGELLAVFVDDAFWEEASLESLALDMDLDDELRDALQAVHRGSAAHVGEDAGEYRRLVGILRDASVVIVDDI